MEHKKHPGRLSALREMRWALRRQRSECQRGSEGWVLRRVLVFPFPFATVPAKRRDAAIQIARRLLRREVRRSPCQSRSPRVSSPEQGHLVYQGNLGWATVFHVWGEGGNSGPERGAGAMLLTITVGEQCWGPGAGVVQGTQGP